MRFCHHLVSVVCFLLSFGSFGEAVSGETILKIGQSANQKQELPVTAMLVNGSGQNVQSLEKKRDNSCLNC
jgi:hypothetical protein